MALPRTDLGAEEEEEKRRGLLTFRQCQVASTSASDSALTFSGVEPRRFRAGFGELAPQPPTFTPGPPPSRTPPPSPRRGPISGRPRGHHLLCSPPSRTEGERRPLRRHPARPERPALQDGGARQPLTLLAARALESAHHQTPPGHLLPTGPPHSPARPAEGGRGPRPRRRARTASLQFPSGVLLRSRSLRTDWDKMAEPRGRSRQPAHLTRKYRPSLSPPAGNLPPAGKLGVGLPLSSVVFRIKLKNE